MPPVFMVIMALGGGAYETLTKRLRNAYEKTSLVFVSFIVIVVVVIIRAADAVGIAIVDVVVNGDLVFAVAVVFASIAGS